MKKCVKIATLFEKTHQIFREILQHFNTGWNAVWIDLSDLETEGLFRWGDGVLASDGWANWNSGEPNNVHRPLVATKWWPMERRGMQNTISSFV